MLQNMLHDLVEVYGFVPNGGRVYYELRSQPPMLTAMVARYLNVTNPSFVYEALPILQMEYNFWMTNRNVTVIGRQLTAVLNYAYYHKRLSPFSLSPLLSLSDPLTHSNIMCISKSSSFFPLKLSVNK